jgi:hypothetical protein
MSNHIIAFCFASSEDIRHFLLSKSRQLMATLTTIPTIFC